MAATKPKGPRSLPRPNQSGQLIRYKTGQFYLLLTTPAAAACIPVQACYHEPQIRKIAS